MIEGHCSSWSQSLVPIVREWHSVVRRYLIWSLLASSFTQWIYLSKNLHELEITIVRNPWKLYLTLSLLVTGILLTSFLNAGDSTVDNATYLRRYTLQQAF